MGHISYISSGYLSLGKEGTSLWSSKVLVFLLIQLLNAQAYIPGIGPTEYPVGEKISVQVAYLQSNALPPLHPYDAKFPFCKPKVIQSESQNIGHLFLPDEIKNSLYQVEFLRDASCKLLCLDVPFGAAEKDAIRKLVQDKYMFNMILDQLYALDVVTRTNESTKYTIGVPLGYEKGDDICIYNHYRFVIYYDEKEVGLLTQGGLPSPFWSASNVRYRIVRFEVAPYSTEQITGPTQVSSCNISPLPTNNVSQNDNEDTMYKRKEFCINSSPDKITFTYDVVFKPTSLTWSERWDVYFQNSDDTPLIHWFSIINSLIVLLLLSAMVAMILFKVLYKDIHRYNEFLVDEEDADEDGWKLVHGDVFRKPMHCTTLAALVGSGLQLLGVIIISVIIGGLGGSSRGFRSNIIQILMLVWTLMGTVAGYSAARLYKLFKSMNWKLLMMRTVFLFPGFVFLTFFVMNVILWSENSSGTVSFGGLFTMLLMWLGITIPLCLIGGYVGMKQKAIQIPVRVNKIPRQVPKQPWYLNPIFCCLAGSALPFGAMLTELFLLFTSIWQHRIYYLFGFLFLVLIILCITCAEISITFVYFQLISEDYNWWWRSFFYSGTSGVYVLLYSMYYFYYRGQAAFSIGSCIYFGHSLIMACICFLITGSVGFLASFCFVKKIYNSIKVE